LVRTISYNNGRYLTTYAISQKLFGSDVSTYTSRVRTMELDYVTDFGIKNKKQIYDIQTYNGNTRVQSEIYIDNKKASEYYGKPVQKSVFHISIESQEPISVIRYVIRSFVTKEEN
jgi:CRISPR/Cas system-associated endoribonuclease Cas2